MLKSQSKVFVFSRDISFLAEAPNFEMKQVKKTFSKMVKLSIFLINLEYFYNFFVHYSYDNHISRSNVTKKSQYFFAFLKINFFSKEN